MNLIIKRFISEFKLSKDSNVPGYNDKNIHHIIEFMKKENFQVAVNSSISEIILEEFSFDLHKINCSVKIKNL